MRKYEFTGEEIVFDGQKLHRIRALVDIPLHGVKAGDLGGFIAHEYNLRHEGACWVGGNAKVYEFAVICDDALVTDEARVYGVAKVGEYAKVYGYTEMPGENFITGKATVYGFAKVNGVFKW